MKLRKELDMSEKVEYRDSTIGICGLLGLLFIFLKLEGTIDWSWGWVLAPFWIPAALVAGILFVVIMGLWICKKLQ